MKRAGSLAAKPRQALLETKRLSRDVIGMTTEGAMSRMFEVISERLQSDEHRQEVQAYLTRLKQRH